MTSRPLFIRILRYGALLALVVAVLGAVGGGIADGGRGVVSALIGAVMAFVFTGVTAGSILVADRVTRGDLLNPAFLGIVVGGWLLKFVVFLVLLVVLKDQPWVNTVVLAVAIIVAVVGSLVIDVVLVSRSRTPYVDVALPGEGEPKA